MTDLGAPRPVAHRVDGDPSRPVRRSPIGETGSSVVVVAALVVLAGLAWWAQRDMGFAADEWDVLAHYVDGGFLTPYNGHLSIVPVMIYQFFAHTVGIDSYRPYGTLGIVVFLAIPVAFALTHRREVDKRIVVLASLAIAWSWGAQTNLLYGFLINFDLPIVMLVVAWWLIRRDTVADDVWAMGALAVALASSSVGIVAACAIGFELLLRRVPLRRLVRFAPPVVVWFTWWWFNHEATKPSSLADKVSYAWHMSVAILAGFTGGWRPGAALVAVALVAVGIVAHRRWRAVDAHVVATLGALVVFVVLTSISRAGDLVLNPTDSPRYVFLGQFLLIAALVWCVRGRVLHTAVTLVLGAVVVVGAVALAGHIDDYRDYVVDYGRQTRPYLVGAEAAGAHADQNRILPLNFIPVTVGQYLHLVDRVGSPVAGTPFASLGAEPARRAADEILGREAPVRLQTVQALPRCASGWRTRQQTGTTRSGIPLQPGEMLAIAPASSADVRLRRLARSFPTAVALRVHAPGFGIVAPRDDRVARDWWVRVDGAGVVVRRCASP